MGWTNTHLYEIGAGDVGWDMPDPDWRDGPLDARKAHLDNVLEDIGTKTPRYLYDFGSGWEHTIKIERLLDSEPGALYLRLITLLQDAAPRRTISPNVVCRTRAEYAGTRIPVPLQYADRDFPTNFGAQLVYPFTQ